MKQDFVIEHQPVLFNTPSEVVFEYTYSDRFAGRCTYYGTDSVVVQLNLEPDCMRYVTETVVHELVHVLQWYNSGKTGYVPVELPFDAPSNLAIEHALLGYPERVHPEERQARCVEYLYSHQPMLVIGWMRSEFARIKGEEISISKYAEKCVQLMETRDFFPPNRGDFIMKAGGIAEVILNHLHTPWGLVKEADLALLNRQARLDATLGSVKATENFADEVEKSLYVECIKYWAGRRDVIELMK